MTFQVLGEYTDLLKHYIENPNAAYYIGIDIGGTNTRVVCATQEGHYFFVSRKFSSSTVTNLVISINEIISMMNKDGLPYPKSIVIDLAGPHVSKDEYKITNYHSDDNILNVTRLNWKREDIRVLNDLEAGAYGIVPYIKAGTLNDLFCEPFTGVNRNSDKGVYTVLAAGTGLGGGMITFNHNTKDYRVIPAEFGHISMTRCEIGDEQVFDGLRAYLRKVEPERTNFDLEFEDIVSGRGIKALYMIYKSESDPILESHQIASKAIEIIDSEDVDRVESCHPTVRAMYIHYKYLFRTAKELGVGLFTNGTFLLGDNIVHNQKILKHFKKYFVEEYLNHYKIEWLRQMPVYPQKIEINLNLIGTIYFAIHNLN